MPRYEFVEGTSKKFWQIDLKGASFTTTWGRIGTAGQSKRQDFADEVEAWTEYELLIKSKEKKGYQRVDDGGPSVSTVERVTVRLTSGTSWIELVLQERSLTQRRGHEGSDDGPEEQQSGFDTAEEAKEQLAFLVESYCRKGVWKESARKTERVELLSSTPGKGKTAGHPEYEAACLAREPRRQYARVRRDW